MEKNKRIPGSQNPKTGIREDGDAKILPADSEVLTEENLANISGGVHPLRPKSDPVA